MPRDHYETYSAYMRHWREIQHATSANYVCEVCGRIHSTRPHAVSCVKRHGFHNTNQHIKSVPVRNENYVHVEPEDTLPPRKGSEEERRKLIVNEPLKQAAALERRRKAYVTPIHWYDEELSRDSYIDIKFKDGKSIAEWVIRGQRLVNGNAVSFIKKRDKYRVPVVRSDRSDWSVNSSSALWVCSWSFFLLCLCFVFGIMAFTDFYVCFEFWYFRYVYLLYNLINTYVLDSIFNSKVIPVKMTLTLTQ